MPDFLRGQTYAQIRGCYCGSIDEGEQLLSYWREWRAPVVTDGLEAEARALAMDNARQRAQSLAVLAGVNLGDIQVMSEIISQPVYPLPGTGSGAMMEASMPSISLGQLSYQMHIQVTFEMK